jgi:hypothetical protein
MIKINDTDGLVEYFKKQEKFTKDEIRAYYAATESELKDNTLKWRIYKLMKSNVISSIGRGIYVISQKTTYQPEPDKYMEKANKIFQSRYTEINYCIWYSGWLYSFMQHQPFSSFYIFEVEKEICKEVFHLFQDNKLNAFYHPNEQLIDDYVSNSSNAIIIKPLISRSPVYNNKKIKLASIEKILVDIYCDRKIYPIFNLSEIMNIFENAYTHYNINIAKLVNYARRRKKEQEIKEFISKHVIDLF